MIAGAQAAPLIASRKPSRLPAAAFSRYSFAQLRPSPAGLFMVSVPVAGIIGR